MLCDWNGNYIRSEILSISNEDFGFYTHIFCREMERRGNIFGVIWKVSQDRHKTQSENMNYLIHHTFLQNHFSINHLSDADKFCEERISLCFKCWRGNYLPSIEGIYCIPSPLIKPTTFISYSSLFFFSRHLKTCKHQRLVPSKVEKRFSTKFMPQSRADRW